MKPADKGSRTAGAPHSVRQPDRILLIDDDASLRRSVARMLSSAGFAVESVESGEQGMKVLLRSPPPSAVILDFYMPVQRGDEVLRQLRAKYPSLLILVLSGVVNEDNYAKLVALGASECVPKADMEVALVPRLRNLLVAQRVESRLATESMKPVGPATVRENTRYPIALPVSVKADNWDQYAVLYTGNISYGGLFIRMADPCAVGTGVRVRMGLPNGRVMDVGGQVEGRVMELGAEVAHVVASESSNQTGKRAGIGIRFVNLSEEQRTMIAGFVDTLRDAEKRDREAVPRADGLQAPDAVGAGSGAEEDEESLAALTRAHLADLKEQDYFTVLGVGSDADPATVRAGYLRLAKVWHPSRFALKSSDVRAHVNEIFIVVKKACDTLSDPAKKEAYRARIGHSKAPERVAPTPMPAASPTPPPASPRPATSPRILHPNGKAPLDKESQLGEKFMASGQFAPARKAFERALKRDPHSVYLRTHHAYACARDALQRSQPAEATQWLELALAADSEFRDAIDLLRELKDRGRKTRQGILQRLFGDA